MSKDSLSLKLINLNGFRTKYHAILYRSVSSQFSKLITNQYNDEVDWKYLLECASILSQSNEGECQDIAFRIAQFTITSKNESKLYKNAALIILDTLTNYTAINLASKRNLINDNYIDEIPIPLFLDLARRKFKYSIWNVNSESILQINKFQQAVYEKCFTNKAVSISAPTSSGKSYILLRIIMDFIVHRNIESIVYIVPTRALIQQVQTDINNILKENNIKNFTVSSVPQIVNDITQVRIYIFTQERLQWILDQSEDFYPELLIVDEAQKIGDGSRGILLQQCIEEVSLRNLDINVIFASPMTNNPELLLEILPTNVSKIDITSEQVTVNQNLIWVNSVNSKEKKWNMKLCTKEGIVELGTFYTAFRPDTVGKRLPFIAHALSSVEGGSLIYANGAADAEKIARIIYDLQGKDDTTSELEELISFVKKTVHIKYDLVNVLKRRIAFHYGNMPIIIKNEIERLFKDGIIHYLICTSTLMEGVNLPAKTIFLRAPQKGRNKPMDAVDFWNLAGRAGRQGKEFQGNIVCIDTDDETLWKGKLFKDKIKYPIHSTVNDTIRDRNKELIQYMNEEVNGSLIKRDSLFDYTITCLISELIHKKRIEDSKIYQILSADIIDEMNKIFATMLEKVCIPLNIQLIHHGISPMAQQHLLDYFITKDENELDDLIPLMPEDTNALDNYIKIISRINKYLDGNPNTDHLSYYKALLVVNWMRGHSLSRIISANEKYYSKNEKKNLSSIIRDTMRDIEEYVRFLFVKTSACYINILRYHFTQIKRYDLINKIPELNIWLEFGASQNTQISLMNLGLSRTTAISLSQYIASDELTSKECIEWIKANDINQLELSHIIKEEIKVLLNHN